MVNEAFWKGKKVFLTGHSGFKGSWMSLWLVRMGAHVTGYALAPATNPSLYELARLEEVMDSHIADINDRKKLSEVLCSADPDIVIHMAAQPYVGASYTDPVWNFRTNLMGTVNLLEAVRDAVKNGSDIKAVVNVTTDKCYENKEWIWGYRENEPLGGKDPYSASKACSEIITSSYRSSFFLSGDKGAKQVAVATARAGNVIGGGDWSADRLIPQCLDALLNNHSITLRRPSAIRPWQHVLEPLGGYLILAEKLYEHGEDYAESWNFGPDYQDCRTVGSVVKKLLEIWEGYARVEVYPETLFQESDLLMLDCSKAKTLLGWKPIWDLNQALEQIVDWTQAHQNKEDMREVTGQQIQQYMKEMKARGNKNG